MSEDESDHYRFPPLERRGLLLGLSAGPLATLAVGAIAAVVALGALPGATGAVVALGAVAVAGVVACWPLSGAPPLHWAPLAGGWLLRRRAMPALDSAPLAGAGTSRSRRADGPRSATAPTGIVLRAAAALPGEGEVGIIEDRSSGRWAALVPVEGPALGLLGPSDAAAQVARWGAVLAALARDGGSVRRLQWVQRCSPADPAPLLAAAYSAPGPEAACASYRRSVEADAASLATHRTLLVLAVGASRHLPGRRVAEGMELALRRELRLVRVQLHSAGIGAGEPLDPSQVRGELAAGGGAAEPGGASLRGSPWPGAVDEAWSSVRVDGSWQATYWVAEWPRLPVGPDVLVPLLSSGGARVISVVLAPVAPDRAVRQAQAARTADIADDAMRNRAGFTTSARRSREAEAVRRREYELADGHGDYRYSGYLTAAAATAEELAVRCGEIEQLARRSGLVLRRLYGRQAEARTWTLPLGRGLS